MNSVDIARSRIVIDARMIGPTGHGIARYVQLMARGLLQIQREKGVLPYEPVFLVSSQFENGQLPSEFKTIEVAPAFLNPGEILAIPKVLKEQRAALYHSPSFSSLITAPCPWIVTVHDLIHLGYGSLAEKLYYRALLKPFMKKAASVITVSESSRKEIAEWTGIASERIDIVYNPIERPATPDRELHDKILRSCGLERGGYFLCLSNAKAHKNLPMLIDAYAQFRKQRSGGTIWPLVITAEGLRTGPGVKALGGVDDPAAQALLASAGALFYPSLAEGFGRPPLEAAVSGVPIVVSRIPPHEEALRDLEAHEVLWEDPRDHHGWVNAFHRVSREEQSPPSVASCEKILTRYSVRLMGEEMDRIYRRVLKVGS